MARVKSEGQGKRLVVSAFDMGEERSGEAFESSWIEGGKTYRSTTASFAVPWR